MPFLTTHRLVSRLIINGLKYRFHRLSGFSGVIEALSIEVTHRCMARCLMCNIWRIPAHVPDLPVDDWLMLLGQPAFRRLKELDVTGGEPFLREDLTSLMRGVSELKAARLNELRSVALTTNGFLTDKVLSGTSRIAQDMKEAGLDLVVVLAMDGIGEVHDRIRNVKNGWKKLAATIDGLIELRRTCDNIIIGLKTTVLPLNVDELNGVAQFAAERGLFTIISPCIITGGRYANEDLRENLQFSREDVQKMIRFFESPAFQWSYHRRGLLDFLKTGTISKPCSAGFNYLFIRSTGDVYPCPLIKDKLGNFMDTSIGALIESRPARRFRRRIGQFEACTSCTEPGLERYALPFEGFSYLKLLLALGRKDFLAFHAHAGLDKYV
ncbi:MAG: radical SAM/SPASM domain-containing protein [Syntrophorhabdales bacterium]